MKKKQYIIVICILSLIGIIFIIQSRWYYAYKMDDLKTQIASLEDEKVAMSESKDAMTEEYQQLIGEKDNEIEKLMQNTVDSQSAIDELEEQVYKLNEIVDDELLPSAMTKDFLEKKGVQNYELIEEDLLEKGKELITFDGVLGGQMYMSEAKLLNESWVLGTFEDGHIMGYGIYEYQIQEDGLIKWTVIKEILY